MSTASRYGFAIFSVLLWGCSSTPAPPAPATGGSPPASGGASGGTPASAGASSGGSSSSAGAAPPVAGASSGGNAGSAGSGPSGGASSGGSAGSGGGGGAASSGISCAPTKDGEGVHDQPPPYGKPPEATVKAGVPVGTLSALTPFPSTTFEGHVFGYQIYVPAQYKPGKAAALAVVQDGPSHYLGKTDAKFFANVVFDNLIAEGSIPVTIGLFIDPCMTACDADRVTIYDAVTDKFAKFELDELIPAVLKDYTIVKDPEAWVGIGFSAGAEQSFTVAWNRPEAFHKLIGHNTSFLAAKANGVDYAQLVPASPNKGFRVSLVSGTMDLEDQRGNWLVANKEMEMVLAAKGYPVRLMTGTGGHYPPDQSAMDFPNALRWMWQGCKLSDY